MLSTQPGAGGVRDVGLSRGVRPRLAELEAVLAPLVPALEALHAAQLEQRTVVVAGDLSAMVVVNTRIEETSARIALLEQRRQAVQAELEEELGVQGLRAVLKAAAIPPTDRARLGQRLVQVARLVRTLREEGRRNTALLDAAVDAAQRTRLVLERLSGKDTTYSPVKARRQQAALRQQAAPAAGTGHTPAQQETTPPVQALDALAAQSSRAGEDTASSAPRPGASSEGSSGTSGGHGKEAP